MNREDVLQILKEELRIYVDQDGDYARIHLYFESDAAKSSVWLPEVWSFFSVTMYVPETKM